VCHLGAGCSATAVLEGSSVDTSMGFTPLEGLMMVRRSGSIDPGLLLYLLRQQGVSADALDRGLNEQAGLAGVSGVSAALRAVLAAADHGDARSRLAVEMFVHRVVATLGGLVATLGGLDALVFTGGIGEHSLMVRGQVAASLEFLGLRLDAAANAEVSSDADIAATDSRVRVLVITAREDLAVLRDVRGVLGWT
jgi:acetate kinase